MLGSSNVLVGLVGIQPVGRNFCVCVARAFFRTNWYKIKISPVIVGWVE